MILNGGKSMRSFRMVSVCGSSFATSCDKGTACGGGPPRPPPPPCAACPPPPCACAGACASSMVTANVVESTNTNRNSQRKAFIDMPPVFATTPVLAACPRGVVYSNRSSSSLWLRCSTSGTLRGQSCGDSQFPNLFWSEAGFTLCRPPQNKRSIRSFHGLDYCCRGACLGWPYAEDNFIS